MIKPGFYTGLNAYQFDGLHVSEIIQAAQFDKVEEVKAGFNFKSLCKAVSDQLSMHCIVVNLTANCFKFRSLLYIVR